MDSKTYWEETDPLNFWAYQKKYTLEREEKVHLMNLEAWLSGKYNQMAIASSLSDKVEYPTEAIDISFNTKEIEELAIKEQELEQAKIKATYDSHLFNLAKRFQQDKEQQEKEIAIERG